MQAEQLGGRGTGCGQGLGASTWTWPGMESIVCSYGCCWVCSLAGEMNPDEAAGTGHWCSPVGQWQRGERSRPAHHWAQDGSRAETS